MEERNILDQAYKEYGEESGLQLSAITHISGSPWEKTWAIGKRNSIISNDLVMEYYKEKYNNLS